MLRSATPSSKPVHTGNGWRAIYTLPSRQSMRRWGFGRSKLAVTRLHAPNGFTDPTSPIPLEKAFSIHLHLRANQGGRLWLSGKLVPTGKRPSGGVTILDLEQDPIAFFPSPIEVVQFYIPRMALEEFAYENRIAIANTLSWPHCEMDTKL